MSARVDLAQLNAVSLETRCWDKDVIEAAIERVLHDKGWLVLYTHDVSDDPSPYGSTPEMLDWALGRVAAAGIEVLPMREAVAVAVALGLQGLLADRDSASWSARCRRHRTSHG